MYIVLGDQIIDSMEFIDTIEANSDFTVEKDLTKATKREDVLAYKISIPIEELNNLIRETHEIEEIDEDELFDEYMSIADELAMSIEEYMEEDTLINTRAYKWDNSDDTIKVVIAVSHYELGELKLKDVTKRLLNQVD